MEPIFTIAAISDVHVNKYPLSKDFFTSVNENADLFIIGGDMNDGKPSEVSKFLDLISGVTIPMVIIFGNHDCSSGNVDNIKESLTENSLIKILDGDYTEYQIKGNKIGIAGTKGFGGGFAPHRIVGRGEKAIQDFIQEENIEVEKLQRAVDKMQMASLDYKIVVTHWAAFPEVVEGEPRELYTVLGSSRLGDVIDSVKPELALSGHAHHGPIGIKKTRGLVSACNIAYKVNNGRMLLFDFFSPEKINLRHIEIQSDIS
jgi:Icc-related predicted phosphoesterase